MGVFGLGLWCCPSFAGCSWLGFAVGLLMGRVWFRARFACPPPFSVPVCGVGVRAGPGSLLCPALLGWVVGVCFLRFFVFLFFSRLLCVPVPGLVVCPPIPSLLGWAAGFFFFRGVCLLASVPLFPVARCSCLGVAGFGGPPVPLWGSSLRCPLGGGFGRLLCCWRAVWWLWAVFAPPPLPPLFFFSGGGACLFLPLPSLGWRTHCGWCVVWLVPRHSWRRFLCATPRHSWLGFAAGGGGRCPPLLAGVRWRRWCVVCGVWCVVCGGGVLVGLWLVCGVVRPSPLLAEVPVCYSPPLLAGFRCRWWWAVPATPGWGPLAAVVCGVWCVAVVCGGGVLVGLWLGVWCGWSLATPGGGSCVLLPATPCWVSLLVVVGGPRHSWLVSAGGGGVWCVVCGGGVLVGFWLVCGVVGPSPLLAEVPMCYSPPLLAGFRCRWWWAVPATPGWGLLAAVVCGGGVLVGLWLVCGVVGPSPLLAEVPVCYSPPLLAGFRCRWWWAVPATPGWGPLAAVVCGVWCVVCGVWRWCVGGVVAGVWRGWSLATPGGGSCVLLPATPGWVSLPVVVGGPRHSWLGSAGGGGVWCVVCGGGVLVGFWLVCGVVGPSPLLAEVPVCYSPPLLAGFRCRWWWAVPATPGWGPLAPVVCGGGVCLWGCGWCVVWLVPRHSWRGSCVLLPATPGWVSLPVVVGGPRHSWLGSAGGGGGWCVACGVWCVAVVCWRDFGWCVVWLVPRHSWRRFLCATPRHSWLGFAAGGGGRSPPLLAGVRWRRWCVVCGVWRWCVGGVVAGVWCGWSLATPGGGSCVLLPATLGWVSLPVVVRGPRHS